MKHSQRANLKPLDVWTIVSEDGSICTAHCKCMAGKSEVCSHVGALLFAVEYTSRKEPVSCTDVRAKWPMPSMTQVPIVPIHDMFWGKPLSANRQVKEEIHPLTNDDIQNMLSELSQAGEAGALMRIIEPFATEIEREAEQPIKPMFDIFDRNNEEKNYTELMKISKSMSFNITFDEIMKIESITRKQASSQMWHSHRSGRITASNFKLVCKTNKEKPSLSLIKTVCYPSKVSFYSKAIAWGRSHEDSAVKKYADHMQTKHENFVVNEVGFLVSSEIPQFGASPDRLVFCNCCLGGCLEVKCPFLLKDAEEIFEYLSFKSTCLMKNENSIILNRNHRYYFQVQMQLFVSQLLYCDFVIWSPKILFIERILPDQDFFREQGRIALKFHSEIIMPELLGRYFTKQLGAYNVQYWCTCNGVDDGRPMIRCDGENCEVQWFHFDCIGLKQIDTEWYCNNCKQ